VPWEEEVVVPSSYVYPHVYYASAKYFSFEKVLVVFLVVPSLVVMEMD